MIPVLFIPRVLRHLLPMSQSRSDARQLADALLAGTHSAKALAAEFAEDSPPVDLAGKTPAELDDIRGCEVLLTPAISSYLASGDALTHQILDNAELALEKHYGIASPFYITSRRKGREGDTLAAVSFYLDKEE